ncbi:MAG: hypothetical protein KDK70_12910, partial [Myxococcales bacterium]|nr:hypothetical protein [Myxococcales bacterium]
MNSEQILVGTRKGTFVVSKVGGRWVPKLVGHPGVGVNFVARDPNTSTLWAALGHGHWGAKLSRSTDGGATWVDAPPVAFPEGARYYSPALVLDEDAPPSPVKIEEATVLKLWILG